jgi:hypothetical protein
MGRLDDGPNEGARRLEPPLAEDAHE